MNRKQFLRDTLAFIGLVTLAHTAFAEPVANKAPVSKSEQILFGRPKLTLDEVNSVIDKVNSLSKDELDSLVKDETAMVIEIQVAQWRLLSKCEKQFPLLQKKMTVTVVR